MIPALPLLEPIVLQLKTTLKLSVVDFDNTEEILTDWINLNNIELEVATVKSIFDFKTMIKNIFSNPEKSISENIVLFVLFF